MSETTDDRSGALVARWRQGDQQAAAELFHRYASRLIALARSRLPAQLSPRVDAEDVVQSVYRSFFAATSAGQYDVDQGSDLWRLLVAITLHKLHHQIRHHGTGKRAAVRDRGFGSEDSFFGLQGPVPTQEPSPLEALALADELEQVMRRLKPLDRRILELRLQGYTIEEVAAATERSERRVYRILEQIKQQLEQSSFTNTGP
jgi:RNA polymerase sigma-70 factor (ECF subfamily)